MINTNKGKIQLTFDEQVEYFGCARIQVKPDNLIAWKILKHQAKIERNMSAALVKSGKDRGVNPEEWYGSLSSIKIDKWIQIEEYKDSKWVLFQKFKY
ncbi:hypothetical protein [Flavobacterium aquidurense]|uniref:hypothetical protein n=1 Tax=Flavobacterium aquidurense TaxID=362413 RepID=UPI003710EE99